MAERKRRQIGPGQVEDFVSGLFEEDVHAKRVASLTDGVDGVLHAARLGIRAIGQGLAAAQGLAPRHAIKQVDRLLSNPKLPLEQLFASWVQFVVGERKEIFVNFDWTEFEDSDQSMVVLGMQTRHGRSTPLVWKTLTRSELRGQRNDHEDDLLLLFAALVPGDVRVTVVADRGFGDTKLYRLLTEEIGFEYLIRFRGGITVEAAGGEKRKACEWGGRGAHARAAVVPGDGCTSAGAGARARAADAPGQSRAGARDGALARRYPARRDLALPPGSDALRAASPDAGGSAACVDEEIRRTPASPCALHRYSRCRLVIEGTPQGPDGSCGRLKSRQQKR